MSNSKLASGKDKEKAKFKRPFPYPLPQFSNFSMDFPVNEDGVLSYQRRYQMTQQQRINRFRQQRNFRSLRDPTFNYSATSTNERYSREGDEEEQQFLMRPTTPTPPMAARRWSPDVERQSVGSWRGSGASSSALRRQQMQQRQTLLRSDGSNNSSSGNRSREEEVVMVENCVSASP